VVSGVSFVNDAYNANPESALAALKAFAEVAAAGGFSRRVLVLGDMLELGDGAVGLHEEVGAAAAAVDADLVIFVGELSRATGEGLMKAGWQGRVESFPDLEQGRAVDAAALLQAGDIVLLKGSRRMKLERVIAAAHELKAAEPRQIPLAPVRAAS
jgi:UDP-N-acetylmuramoyl-tripeptide--D-alanyl-D-alanine ligase